jgi:hypothetical protein
MSKNHVVEDTSEAYEKVNDNDVNEGDTIEVITDNQEGYKKFEVVDNLGIKELKLINSYDDFMGGRRKTRKHKRKSRKSRKSRKNKKNKRKTHKRRSHKRKM